MNQFVVWLQGCHHVAVAYLFSTLRFNITSAATKYSDRSAPNASRRKEFVYIEPPQFSACHVLLIPT